MSQEAIQAAEAAASAASVATAAAKVTYAGSITLIGGWLVSSQAAAFFGLVLGVLGLAVQWWYRHHEYKMRLREHEANMRKAGGYDL